MLQFWGKEQTHFKNKTNKKKTPATSGPVLSFLLPLQLEEQKIWKEENENIATVDQMRAKDCYK